MITKVEKAQTEHYETKKKNILKNTIEFVLSWHQLLDMGPALK